MNRKTQLLVISTLVIIDQIIKIIVNAYLVNPIEIIPDFFQLNYLKNYGVGFSLLNGNQFIIMAISIVLLYMVIKMLTDIAYRSYEIPLLMILAGGIGNFIDRIFRGFVVDYLDFKIFNWDFPVFNFADMLLVIGAILMIIMMIIEEGGNKNA